MIEHLREYSKGNNLYLFWRLFRLRNRTRCRLLQQLLTFVLNRIAHRRGGYIGNGTVFEGVPILPHGLHGVFISRYAKIGADCWIYQNVTIGEVDRLDGNPERSGLEAGRKDTAHGFRCFPLCCRGDVGIGVQGEPCTIVPQHSRNRFDVYSVGPRPLFLQRPQDLLYPAAMARNAEEQLWSCAAH